MPGGLTRELIALRTARELGDGMVVNLGIGLPTEVAGFLPEGRTVLFQAENGILGYGGISDRDFDPDRINAGGQPVRAAPRCELLRQRLLLRDDPRRARRCRRAGRSPGLRAGRPRELVRPGARAEARSGARWISPWAPAA